MILALDSMKGFDKLLLNFTDSETTENSLDKELEISKKPDELLAQYKEFIEGCT